MGETVGQILPLAVVVALSPVPIIGVILMLGTPNGRSNGPAFVLGWVIGLTLAGTIILLVASVAGASDKGAPADWVSILKLVLGLVLFRVALKQWRGRPRAGEEAELPKWMRSVDRFTPGRAVAMGVALSAINPKNLLLIAAAATTIAQAGASAGTEAGALAVFILVATLGPCIPVAVFFGMRERAADILGEIQDWMAQNNATIMAVICLVIGAKLLGDGISGLSA